ncbi:MAG: YaiO family outer membrane beta-barrel protein [Gammaproteobacteria bacterium]|nr:YaiO family outer membrane beta-barrel protein [Gammaproteobacteria bacterium]MBU0787391.1 YaiO family outer membrane beta-barrel protein [Gammaproteobacteria bacterium]MBU0816476.1 YaiO family outer membrane beta-barrel protein [Gammaproteobacteria bacterium]MBU1787670.1 YaiO family outer membrane beta-barrel protein [Gammaproteobacteria bacterium]
MLKKIASPLLLATAPLWFSQAALAQAAAATPPNTLEMSHDQQNLSNNSPDWRETALRYNRSLGVRHGLDLTVLQASRFGLNDEQLLLSYVRPLSDRVGLTADASASPGHNFLPQRSLALTLDYGFAPAWLAYVGLKNTRYTDTTIEQGLLMVERYIGAFSVAAAWRPVQALGTATSSHELRGSYYYGDKNSITLLVSDGQESTQINSNQISLANVSTTALYGRHWISRDWALTYALNSTRQGDFYTRNGLRFGVQHIF